jgi:hypothetical protein
MQDRCGKLSLTVTCAAKTLPPPDAKSRHACSKIIRDVASQLSLPRSEPSVTGTRRSGPTRRLAPTSWPNTSYSFTATLRPGTPFSPSFSAPPKAVCASPSRSGAARHSPSAAPYGPCASAAASSRKTETPWRHGSVTRTPASRTCPSRPATWVGIGSLPMPTGECVDRRWRELEEPGRVSAVD